jgi:hypothetical protein
MMTTRARRARAPLIGAQIRCLSLNDDRVLEGRALDVMALSYLRDTLGNLRRMLNSVLAQLPGRPAVDLLLHLVAVLDEGHSIKG